MFSRGETTKASGQLPNNMHIPHDVGLSEKWAQTRVPNEESVQEQYIYLIPLKNNISLSSLDRRYWLSIEQLRSEDKLVGGGSCILVGVLHRSWTIWKQTPVEEI